MKISISHIPEKKQEELNKAIEIIKKVSKGNISIEMIILFGSYARGDFVVKDVVQEGNNCFEYKSDFDILVITKKPMGEKNTRLSGEISKIINEDNSITSPVSILIEDIYHINNKLEENRYFYLDIKREGILLYDSKKFNLKSARTLSEEEKNKIKQEDYEMWFSSANEFFIDYGNAFTRGSYKIAVFYLHQSAERYITAFLLVKTGYKPKSHDLEVLYRSVKEINESFDNWFSEDENSYFELLRKAYVDARYSKEYIISKDEILILKEKVLILKDIVEKLCRDELEK